MEIKKKKACGPTQRVQDVKEWIPFHTSQFLQPTRTGGAYHKFKSKWRFARFKNYLVISMLLPKLFPPRTQFRVSIGFQIASPSPAKLIPSWAFTMGYGCFHIKISGGTPPLQDSRINSAQIYHSQLNLVADQILLAFSTSYILEIELGLTPLIRDSSMN